MKHIHKCFQTKKIFLFIADLINDYDYKCFDDLSSDDKYKLAALLIEAAGRSGEAECIVESPHLDQTMSLLRKALCGTKDDDQNFLYAIKENTVDYFEYTMAALFNHILDDLQRSRHEWLDHIQSFGDPDEAYDQYREGLT